MNKPNIIRIPILPLGMVNAHAIVGTGGCILVDTGIPGSERKIERELNRNGLTLKDIALIVITHAHTDHAGSAARLRELSGAPIVAHVDDLDYYERRKEMTYCVTSWWGPVFLRSGAPGEPYTGFTPDILLKNDMSLDLRQFGVEGLVKHTPGHTAGSISVRLESGDAFVGDLIASGIFIGGLIRTGHAIRPPFEDDPEAVGVELMHLIKAGATRFHMGHGGPLETSEVRRHALSLRDMEPGQPYKLRQKLCSCNELDVASTSPLPPP